MIHRSELIGSSSTQKLFSLSFLKGTSSLCQFWFCSIHENYYFRSKLNNKLYKTLNGHESCAHFGCTFSSKLWKKWRNLLIRVPYKTQGLTVYINSRGTEIFPFSYFENPWLEYDLVINDIKNIHNFHKTRTYGLNFGRESFHRGHHVTP